MQIYKAVPGEPLPLGRRYERNATRIVFDIAAWVDAFGPGTVRLLHQRPGDAAPYPVAIARTGADGNPDDDSGTLVLWDVTNADTAQAAHYGRAELRYYSGAEGAEGFLVKSDIYKTVVENALGAASDPPEEAESWLEALLRAADGIEDAAQTAQSAASESATNAADAAAALAAMRSIEIDAERTNRYASDAYTYMRQARRAADEAAQLAAQVAAPVAAAVCLPFSNSPPPELSGVPDLGSVTLYDGDDDFTEVVSGRFIAAAGANVSLRASVGMSVATVAGGGAMGWTALSDATVTARCLFDNTPTDTRTETFDSGNHLMNTQFRFVPETDGTHTFAFQMRIEGGEADIEQNAAALEVSGVTAAPDI